MTDSFYTPSKLAEYLLSFVQNKSFANVADFCLGDGALLRAAENVWPEIICYGTDISTQSTTYTRTKHPNWNIDQIDFLDNIQRFNSPVVAAGRFDLILLNPPFSCKGGTFFNTVYRKQVYKVSNAMRFLSIALTYLKKDGVLLAILPSSVAYSERDSKLWEQYCKDYNLTILSEPGQQYFKYCDPSIIVVSLNDFSLQQKARNIPIIPIHLKTPTVLRGKVSMHTVTTQKKGLSLIHTTNLIDNRIQNPTYKSDNKFSVVSGPAVLIPRVGKPLISKICRIKSDQHYAISDCIIAIVVTNDEEAAHIMNFFISHWELLEDMYKGTGARYITLAKVKKILNINSCTGVINQKVIAR